MKAKKRGCEEKQTKERAHEQVGAAAILQICVLGSGLAMDTPDLMLFVVFISPSRQMAG
jgi:hypothetical protein